MNNAPTPEGRGHNRPDDAELLFPSEGPFNPVVPLSELGDAPAPLPAVDPADVGRPAEAAWAREAHRARLKEDEETLVPARADGVRSRSRRSWAVTACIIALSVAAGVASGSYLIWTSQRAHESPPPPPEVAAEAPSVQPAPAAVENPPAPKVEKAKEVFRDAQTREVVKTGKTNETAHAPKQVPLVETTPPASAPPRAAAEPKRSEPARVRSVTTKSPRTARAEAEPKAALGRDLPISSPPPSARSKKVIQWP